MKKIEVLAILALLLTFASLLVRYGLGPITGELLANTDWTPSQVATGALVFRTLPYLFIQIGVAIWLFRAARRSAHIPWVWALFGLSYGLVAAILFYVMRLHQMSEQQTKCEQHGGQISSEGAPSAPPDESSP